ncbi:VENN motif pre-toxin domain-containing protein [Pasteurellaceae bacterium 20609_3]|nr:VENN motif pre-toxin domain-containing protein [Spirabiliibacterium mucosae]
MIELVYKSIKQATTDENGKVNQSANLLAHAVLGAAEALATGNNALAGAAGAATGEVAAKLITEQLYNTTPDKLSEAQKETVSALSQLASGLSGVLAGDNTGSGITAAQSGKSAVENNYLFKQEATRQSELLAKQQKEGLTKEEKDELSELHKRDIERDNNLQTACHLGMTSTCANELISLSNAFHSYGNPKDELQNNSIRSEYLDVAMKYSEAKRQYAEDVAREALSKIASENITNSTELVKITAKAITGDEASQSQLHEMGQAIKAFVQSPVGVISDNIKAELAEADRLESQGLIREADVKRMQVYLSTELGVLGSASGLSNVAIVGSKVAIKGANMATKELHSLGKLASTSTKETLDRGGNIIGPSGNMLNNKYTYLGDGMFIGPNGGKIVNTGRVDKTTGNVIFQRVTDDNSYVNQFVMIDNDGLQISVPRPSGLKIV